MTENIYIYFNFHHERFHKQLYNILINNSRELRLENKGVIRLCSKNKTNGSANNEVVAWWGSSVQQNLSRKKKREN